jgi:hypothetical protein
MSESKHEQSRRDFLRKVGYVAPVILTMKSLPALAGLGSHKLHCEKGNNGIGQEKRGIIDGPPPGLAKQPEIDFNDTGNFAGRHRGRN